MQRNRFTAVAPKMRCAEDQTKDNICLGQPLSEPGEEKSQRGTLVRSKIRTAKQRGKEKESQREEEWSDRVRRCRAGRKGGGEGWLRERAGQHCGGESWKWARVSEARQAGGRYCS